MFAIIDIETCGGKFEFRKGRIIEIAIVLHDGLEVTETFSTLVNPECYISPYFTNISGITNEMVADAPTFQEIAKKIIELTDNRIFVAHNVSFDYGFVRDEFKSLGYDYRKETLCTVRMSRKLIPGRISYSLGHLCASLGIEIENRHRAEGDAVATSILFNLLLKLKAEHPLYKNVGTDELMSRKVDKIKSYVLKKIPESCGVYFFLNKDKEVIYVGKSTNMYQRAIAHFNSKESKSLKLLNELHDVDFIETGSELIALLRESEEIKKIKPKYNRARKRDLFSHSIEWYTNKMKIISFKISPYEEAYNRLLNFTSYASARERLERLIDEYQLCLSYCGLTSDGSICFNHQIKNCKGICAGEEEVEDYNKRCSAILNEYQFPKSNFVILDKGRHHKEYALILVENFRFAGYDYMDEYNQLTHFEDIRSFISKKEYYPDSDDLIRSWMKNNRFKMLS